MFRIIWIALNVFSQSLEPFFRLDEREDQWFGVMMPSMMGKKKEQSSKENAVYLIGRKLERGNIQHCTVFIYVSRVYVPSKSTVIFKLVSICKIIVQSHTVKVSTSKQRCS